MVYSDFVRFYQKKKIIILKQLRQIRIQSSYNIQLFERIRNPHQYIVRKNFNDLIEDLNLTNLKILKFMVEDQSIQLSDDEICDLLEELTFIQDPSKYTQDNLVEFETRIITILSVLEYMISNIETFQMGANYYQAISDQFEDCVLFYRSFSSKTAWTTSLNDYIPKEGKIHEYNIEFLIEYIFNILKILCEDELQFQKINPQINHYLNVLVKSYGFEGCTRSKMPSSFPPLEHSWESLRNACNFGDSVSPFFTDYYILRRIIMIIQKWCEGDKAMILKHGRRLLMEFMWMHADYIWLEETKCDRKNASNDEIFTQDQLKCVIFLFGILDLMENFIIKSEHLSTLGLVYYFVNESLQRTKSAPIQIKSAVILLKLYFRDGNFFKIIDQDFENYLNEEVEIATHFKTFLSAIKPGLCRESISNDNLIGNFRGTSLSQFRNKRKVLSIDKDMIDMMADEMTCSVALEPVECLCILGCEHAIGFETYLNLSKMSRYRCPQCRNDIKDDERIFLPQHHIYSFFYTRFVAFDLVVSTPPILSVKASRSHYFSTPLLTFSSMTTSPQTYFDSDGIRSGNLSNQRQNIHNDLSGNKWSLKVPKKWNPAYNESLRALNSKKYEEAVLWLTCLLKRYPNSYSARCDRAFVNSLLLRQHFLALGRKSRNG